MRGSTGTVRSPFQDDKPLVLTLREQEGSSFNSYGVRIIAKRRLEGLVRPL